MEGQHHSAHGRPRHAQRMSAALAANEDLVHWTVQRQWLGRLSYQDAVQEGRIALWRALEGYDPRRGALSSYAVVAIERAVWRAARRAQQASHERLRGEVAGEAPEWASALDRVVERAQVRQLVATLPARLGQVVRQRYGLDGTGEATFQEIGRQLGVTKQRAHQLHSEALLHLADPATSTALRRQVGRNRVPDYQAYLTRRRSWQRRGRSGR